MAEQEVCYPRVKNTGLRGIPVADTKISYIYGIKGELQYRGFRIEDLADHSTYEEVAYLLLTGRLPSKKELAAFDARLRAERAVPDAVLAALVHRPARANPMDVLQGTVSLLADHDPDKGGKEGESHEQRSPSGAWNNPPPPSHRVGQVD